MQNIQIRKATIEDIEIIQKLNKGLFQYEMERDLDVYVNDWSLSNQSFDYFKDLIENQFVIIAQNDRQAIGYLAGSIYSDDTYSYYEGKTAEIENMFILENCRHLGIGSKLINSFIEYCKTQEVKRIFVTATLGNDNTISFYRKHGFKDLNITLKKEL